MNPTALTDFFFAVALNSWRASWLILAVVALRVLVRGRIPAQIWFAAWLVVALRLLLPFTLPARWSPYNLMAPNRATPAALTIAAATPSPTPAAAAVRAAAPLAGSSAVRSAPAELPVAANAASNVAPASAALNALSRSRTTGLAVAWLGIAVLLALVRAGAAWQFRRRLCGATPEDARVRAVLAREAAAWPGAAGVRCLETDVVRAPALYGMFRARLLVPPGLAAQLTDEELRLVICHELAHWRRRDLLAQLLLHAAVIVHWFNPLAWLAARLARADCELACDEFVLRRERHGDAGAYGSTLLKVLGVTRAAARQPAVVVGILEGRQQLAHRVRMISGFKSSTAARTLAGVALIGALAALSVTREARAQSTPARRAAVTAPPAGLPTPAAVAPAANAPATPVTVETPRAALELQRQRLEDLAHDLQAFKERHNLASLDSARDFLNEHLKSANAELTRAQLALNSADARVAQIKAYRDQRGDLSNLPFIASQPLVAALTQQLAARRVEFVQLNQKYSERHPEIVQANQIIAETEKELVRAIDAACRQVDAERDLANRNYEAARQQLAQLEARSLELGRVALDYESKQRDLRQQEQAVASLAARESDRTPAPIVDARGRAASPTAESPAAPDSFTVSVVGAVNNQSAVGFAGRDQPIVLDAIARAGGFAGNANRGAVRILRAGPDGARRTITFTEEMLMSGSGDAGSLQRGDVIIVPDQPPAAPRYVTIFGSVNAPGRVPLPDPGQPKMTIVELIARAGGPSRIADLKQVRVSRVNPKTHATDAFTVDVAAVMRGTTDLAAIELEPGDMVTVPERIL